MDNEVRHPLFARFFAQFSRLMERELGDRRRELLVRHYPMSVDEVVVLEPEAYLRSKAEQAARTAPVRVVVQAAAADPLPVDSGSFDAAVASLVLCTVPNPQAALAEFLRVLKPGGELRFMEHVRSEHPRTARVQDWADRSGIWPRVAGGCHCARNTAGAIESAGFQVEQMRSFGLGPSWGVTHPHVLGRARAPRIEQEAPN